MAGTAAKLLLDARDVADDPESLSNRGQDQGRRVRFIERFYNARRRHSILGYLGPLGLRAADEIRLKLVSSESIAGHPGGKRCKYAWYSALPLESLTDPESAVLSHARRRDVDVSAIADDQSQTLLGGRPLGQCRVALAGTIAAQASSPQRRYGRNFAEGGTGPIRIGTIPKMSDSRRLPYAADTLGTSIASLAWGQRGSGSTRCQGC